MDLLLGAGAHGGEIDRILIALPVLLIAARLGGHLAVRAHQPAVLGELAAGVALGVPALFGWTGLAWIGEDATVDALAQIGVILLLFEVGLESTTGEMMRVGGAALRVACVGVALPFAFGWGAGALLLPEEHTLAHVFIGATLTATSVGITARVFRDLGEARSPVARIVLGAAVIDDVLGLVVLAVVTGMVAAASGGAQLGAGAVAWIVGKSVLFLAGALAIGHVLAPRLFRWFSRLEGRGLVLTLSVVFCFLVAWLAGAIGLAPIVGAYAAGLVLEDRALAPFAREDEPTLEHMLHPLSTVLVPLFFVLMGLRVDLSSFGSSTVLALAGLLTAVAILGKVASGWSAWSPGADPLSTGLGMMPRGEVGLIFASIGATLKIGGEPLIDAGLYSAIVIMVLLTTLATPPALRWSFSRERSRRDAGTASARS